MNIPPDLRYSRTHEWVRVQDNLATIGITDYAQNELGDVVIVQLPEPGEHFQQEDIFGVIESVKAVEDLFIPVSGEVVEVNSALQDNPEIVNKDPYVGGWMIVVKMEDPSEVEGLMTAEEYREYLQEL